MMGEYKDGIRGWGTSDQSGEGGEKLCIRERWECKKTSEFLKKKKKGGGREEGLEERSDIPGERICTTRLELGRLHEVHTGLAVEGALNVSCVLKDLPRRFEVLVYILLFNNGAPFLLSRDFFSASTAKLNKFATSSAQ